MGAGQRRAESARRVFPFPSLLLARLRGLPLCICATRVKRSPSCSSLSGPSWHRYGSARRAQILLCARYAPGHCKPELEGGATRALSRSAVLLAGTSISIHCYSGSSIYKNGKKLGRGWRNMSKNSRKNTIISATWQHQGFTLQRLGPSQAGKICLDISILRQNAHFLCQSVSNLLHNPSYILRKPYIPTFAPENLYSKDPLPSNQALLAATPPCQPPHLASDHTLPANRSCPLCLQIQQTCQPVLAICAVSRCYTGRLALLTMRGARAHLRNLL